MKKMFTEREKEDCKKLLGVISDVDLRCLVQTITQNSVAIETRQEAVEAIIEYSGSVNELLNRQKIKKEHLQNYLNKVTDKKLIPIISKSNKEDLIQLFKERLKQVTETDAPIQKVQDPNCQEIAVAFISWFFGMINSLRSSNVDSSWGPIHFWDDAKLVLQIEQPDGVVQDEIQNANDVSKGLMDFVLTYQVVFNPNLAMNDANSNCHGLLEVKSTGTLHRNSDVVGLYEQVFDLMKDPLAEGNWKIKNTELKIKFTSNYQIPIMLS